jgi:hypothetical protein
MRYVLFLCLAACGSPFETGHHLVPESGSEANRPEGSTPEADKDASDTRDAKGEAAPPVDAPTVDVTDASHDVVLPPVDAGHDAPKDATPPKEAAPPPDTGCTPFGTATVLCPDMTAASTTPTNYCVYDSTSGVSTLAATPAECQCKSTYDCSCIEASVTIVSQLCKSTQVYAGCSMVGGAPLVTCEDP